MTPISTLLYCIIGISFILNLVAYTSSSQVKTRRWLILSLLFGILFLGVSFAFDSIVEDPNLLILFIALYLVWPLLLARLIVQQRTNACMAKSQISYSSLAAGIVGVFLMSYLSIASMISNRWNGISPSLFTLPAIILFFMVAVQRAEFNKDGLIYNGLRWSWSDFKTYAWKRTANDNRTVELFLTTKQAWFVKQIKLQIKTEDRQTIDDLLPKGINPA